MLDKDLERGCEGSYPILSFGVKISDGKGIWVMSALKVRECREWDFNLTLRLGGFQTARQGPHVFAAILAASHVFL